MERIEKIKKAICRYITQLNKTYPAVRALISSTIVLSIIFALDILDTPSQFIEGQPTGIIVLLAVSVSILMALWFIQTHFVTRLIMPIVNSADRNIISMTVISSICTLFWTLKDGFSNYKTIVSIILVCTGIIILIIRILFYNDAFKSPVKSDQNIFDLKDIYNNNFEAEGSGPILITEKDADYDLLNRSGLINQLYSSIISFKSERSFVIGLIGEWGSGKTTLINNVRKKLTENNKDVIIIDDFDPWVFGTQEALLISMYDMILQHTGIKFSITQNRNNAKKLSATIADLSSSFANVSGIGKLFSLLSSDGDAYDDINNLKEELGTYLKALDLSINVQSNPTQNLNNHHQAATPCDKYISL